MDDAAVEKLFDYYVKNFKVNDWQHSDPESNVLIMLHKLGISYNEKIYFRKYIKGYMRFCLKSDGCVTLALLLIFIIFFLLCIFQYPYNNVIKRYIPFHDIVINCVSTYVLLFNFQGFKFLFNRNLTMAKNVLGNDVSHMFFIIYKCVYLVLWLCFLYSVIYITFCIKSVSLKHKYVCFTKKLNRRVIIYLLYMLLRVDYSILSFFPSVPSMLMENVVLFLIYYVVFFLLSEICDTYLNQKMNSFSWKELVLIIFCIYVYDKHVYYYNNVEQTHIFCKYLSVDFNIYSFLIYMFTRQLLLF
ncbi:protein E9 [Elephant endotheliotropic herpesvirus 3B]|nr:protein E9 [Elephant endotheliotropic herpesvirus 3B]